MFTTYNFFVGYEGLSFVDKVSKLFVNLNIYTFSAWYNV